MSTKLVDSEFLDGGLTQIANEIRAKTGTSDEMEFPQGFVDAMGNVSGKEIIFSDFYNTEYTFTKLTNYQTTVVTMGATAIADKTILRVTFTGTVSVFPIFRKVKYVGIYAGNQKFLGPVQTTSIKYPYAYKADSSSSSYNVILNDGETPVYTVVESTGTALTIDISLDNWTRNTSSIPGFSGLTSSYPNATNYKYFIVVGE